MPRLNATIHQRIEANSQKTEDGCWEWQRHIDRHGYGHIGVGLKNVLAHRVAYEAFVGPIPAGLVLDHQCDNRCCVNPAHLKPTTNRDNVLRGVGFSARNARITHCPRGHAYEGRNLYVSPNGRRNCRACNCDRSREYKLRKQGGSAS